LRAINVKISNGTPPPGRQQTQSRHLRSACAGSLTRASICSEIMLPTDPDGADDSYDLSLVNSTCALKHFSPKWNSWMITARKVQRACEAMETRAEDNRVLSSKGDQCRCAAPSQRAVCCVFNLVDHPWPYSTSADVPSYPFPYRIPPRIPVFLQPHSRGSLEGWSTRSQRKLILPAKVGSIPSPRQCVRND
jgi:hypothetical protein